MMLLLFSIEKRTTLRLWMGLWITFRVPIRPLKSLPITATKEVYARGSPPQTHAGGLPLFVETEDHL